MKRLTLIATIILFVSFTAAQTSSNIDIELKNSEPTPLQTSEYADIWLEVRNTGSSEADNIEIEFNENYPFSVERGDRKNWSIPELIPGDTYQMHLQTRVDNNAVQGNDTLNFKVETPGISFEEKVPVEVRSDRNILSLNQVNFPEKAAPGSTNQMQLNLENLGSGQLKNIQVSLDTSSENLPLATSGSSQKNIASIDSASVETLNYSLSIDESAENGVYKLPIQINFENEAGTSFEQQTTTGINVGGEPQLDVDLNTEEAITEGTRELTFRLVNKGHGSADFVSMEIQENENIEVIGSDDVYIGSMDSDDFQTASFDVHIEAETESVNINEIKMPVKLEYTDQNGEQSSTKTVLAEFYTREDVQRYGLDSGGSPLPLIAVLLLLVGGGVYYWRRKRKE